MDAAAHYRNLIALGRDEFLASAAPAALVRFRRTSDPEAEAGHTRSVDAEIEETLPIGKLTIRDIDLELHPLIKKPGASFPDRITIGRTANNDIVIPDPSVSRLHAYVRLDAQAWVVADAGSKNGSALGGVALEARREKPLPSRAILRLGDIDLTFYLAADLFAALGGP